MSLLLIKHGLWHSASQRCQQGRIPAEWWDTLDRLNVLVKGWLPLVSDLSRLFTACVSDTARRHSTASP